MVEANNWVKVERASDISIRGSLKENEFLFSAMVWSPGFILPNVSDPQTTTEDGKTTVSFKIPSPFENDSKVINFPQYLFEKSIPIKSNEIESYLYVISRRIRNYFAYKFGEKVPLEVRIISKDIVFPIIFNSTTPLNNDIDEVLNHKETADKKFLDKCDDALWLINSIEEDSLIDKLVNLFGSAIWSEDILDTYMYLWRIIELFSKDFISNLSKSNLFEFKNLLKENELNDVLSGFKIEYKVKITIRKFLPSEDDSKIGRYNELRNEIAHGDITVNTYKRVTSNINQVLEIAKKLTDIKINEIKRVQ